MMETMCLSRMLNRSDSTYHISLNFKDLFKCAVLTTYPKIAKLRWMLLFGNDLNKFSYNNFITEIIYYITIQGVTTMVACNYHGKNFHVYFLV